MRNDFLKLVAIVAMFFDHFGQVFFPYDIYFRIVGRLAMPIFAYGVAEGYRHTSDLKKYVLRLLFLGAISQIPYAYLFGVKLWELNILFTLALSLGLIYSYERKKYLYALPVLLASFFPGLDYGVYGVSLPFIFFVFKGKNIRTLLASAAIFLANVRIMPVSPFHIFSVLAILYWPVNLLVVKLPRYFFYWFYFGHIIFLLAMKAILLN